VTLPFGYREYTKWRASEEFPSAEDPELGLDDAHICGT